MAAGDVSHEALALELQANLVDLVTAELHSMGDKPKTLTALRHFLERWSKIVHFVDPIKVLKQFQELFTMQRNVSVTSKVDVSLDISELRDKVFAEAMLRAKTSGGIVVCAESNDVTGLPPLVVEHDVTNETVARVIQNTKALLIKSVMGARKGRNAPPTNASEADVIIDRAVRNMLEANYVECFTDASGNEKLKYNMPSNFMLLCLKDVLDTYTRMVATQLKDSHRNVMQAVITSRNRRLKKLKANFSQFDEQLRRNVLSEAVVSLNKGNNTDNMSWQASGSHFSSLRGYQEPPNVLKDIVTVCSGLRAKPDGESSDESVASVGWGAQRYSAGRFRSSPGRTCLGRRSRSATSPGIYFGYYRSRSRSCGYSRSRSRSYGHSRSRSRSYGLSRSRSRSFGHSRSRSRSYGHSRSRSRRYGHSRSGSRSCGHSRSGSGSYEHSRSRSRSYGHSRRRSRSMSHTSPPRKVARRSRSRSCTPSQREDSRSESKPDRRAHCRSKSRSCTPNRRIRSRSKSRSCTPNRRIRSRCKSRSCTPDRRIRSRSKSRSCTPDRRMRSRSKSRICTPDRRMRSRSKSRSCTPDRRMRSRSKSRSCTPDRRMHSRSRSRICTPGRRIRSRSADLSPARRRRRRREYPVRISPSDSSGHRQRESKKPSPSAQAEDSLRVEGILITELTGLKLSDKGDENSKPLKDLCDIMGKLTVDDVTTIPKQFDVETVKLVIGLEQMGDSKPKSLKTLRNSLRPLCKFIYVQNPDSFSKGTGASSAKGVRRKHRMRRAKATQSRVTVGKSKFIKTVPVNVKGMLFREVSSVGQASPKPKRKPQKLTAPRPLLRSRRGRVIKRKTSAIARTSDKKANAESAWPRTVSMAKELYTSLGRECRMYAQRWNTTVLLLGSESHSRFASRVDRWLDSGCRRGQRKGQGHSHDSKVSTVDEEVSAPVVDGMETEENSQSDCTGNDETGMQHSERVATVNVPHFPSYVSLQKEFVQNCIEVVDMNVETLLQHLIGYDIIALSDDGVVTYIYEDNDVKRQEIEEFLTTRKQRSEDVFKKIETMYTFHGDLPPAVVEHGDWYQKKAAKWSKFKKRRR